jgi:hypothetical protein
MDDEFPDYGESDSENAEGRLDELEPRVHKLEDRSHTWDNAASSGYVLGSVLAAVLSWDLNHAVGWLLIHSILSWFYVIYRLIVDWGRLKLF